MFNSLSVKQNPFIAVYADTVTSIRIIGEVEVAEALRIARLRMKVKA